MDCHLCVSALWYISAALAKSPTLGVRCTGIGLKCSSFRCYCAHTRPLRARRGIGNASCPSISRTSQPKLRNFSANEPMSSFFCVAAAERRALDRRRTEESLFRTAFEIAEDAASENVRYMEVRYSPMLHTRQGLRLTSVIEAVLDGLVSFTDEVRRKGP